MRELGWNLRKQRWGFLVFAVTAVIGAAMIYQVTDAYSIFEMGYRTMFVLLQLIFMLIQRERFHIVLRKEGVTRFYRSMPHAWEKEKKRFLWIDLFCVMGLAVLLVAGIVFRNEFGDKLLPFAMVVVFLGYMPCTRIVACVPYVWWLTEIVFAAIFLFVPALDISPVICVGTAVVVGVIQFLLYGFIRKLWESED